MNCYNCDSSNVGMLPGDVVAHCDDCGVVWEPAAFEPVSKLEKNMLKDILIGTIVVVIVIVLLGSCGIPF